MQSDGRKGQGTYLCGLNTILSLLDDDQWIYLLLVVLHRLGGSYPQVADDNFEALAACARAVFACCTWWNGVHSSGLNCYRTPAGCLVTVYPPRVHAARRRQWPHDPAPRAHGWLGWIWYDISAFFSS